MKKTFKLVEKDWGPSSLRDDDNKMCCLGQVGVQLGIDPILLYDESMPDGFLDNFEANNPIDSWGAPFVNYRQFDKDTEIIASESLMDHYAVVHGAQYIAPKARISALLATLNDWYFEESERSAEVRDAVVGFLVAGFAEAGYTLVPELDGSSLGPRIETQQ